MFAAVSAQNIRQYYYNNIQRLMRLISLLVCITITQNALSDSLPVFRIGGTSTTDYEVSLHDIEIAFKLLFDEVLVSAGEVSSIKMYRDFNTLWNQYENRNADACIASTLELLDHLNDFHPQGLYALASSDSPFTQYLLITKAGSNQSLEDLKGKRIAMTHHADIGRMYLDTQLLENSLSTHDKYFSEIIPEENSHTAIVNLLFGKIDAILISKNGFNIAKRLNPDIKNKITILLESNEMIPSFIAVRPDFPEPRLKKLHNIATNLHNTPKGTHLLKMFHNERIDSINAEALESVRSLRLRYRELIGK